MEPVPQASSAARRSGVVAVSCAPGSLLFDRSRSEDHVERGDERGSYALLDSKTNQRPEWRHVGADPRSSASPSGVK